jgi:integrase
VARFTTKFIENVKPGPVRREIPDSGCTGLYLVSQSSGVKSWAVRYRYAGRPTKFTLGKFPSLSLHDARVAAAEALNQVRLGNDPAKARQDAKIKADAAKANTLTAICESYLAIEGKKLRSRDARVSILRRHVYPTLGDRPIGEIKRGDIARLLDKVEVNAGLRMADVTLGVLRRIFHWQELRDDEFRSPVIRGMARQRPAEHRRTRILTDDEIRAVWKATEDKTVFSTLVRFLLLTSARRSEASAMKWGEIDADGVWTLPASRSKTKTEIIRPLSKAAQEVLAGLPRFEGCDFAFTTTALTPIRQFSSPKAKLDAASGTNGWTLHDLRRTARSLLSRAGVNSDVAEKCLGHSRGDIIERYDQHKFLKEMSHAFEALAALVEHIVNPPAGDISDIAEERARRQRRRR